MTEILNFDDLIGKNFKFYGATEHQLKLDDMIWEVEEDACDGYRSMLGPISRKVSNAIFFKRPIAKVKVTGGGNEYLLTDVADGHVWLRFGTDNADDYYPWFVFDYQPKCAPDSQPAKESK